MSRGTPWGRLVMRTCYKCGNENGEGVASLRPYGEKGQDICASCCFGDEKSIAIAKEQFDKQLDEAIKQSPSKIVILGGNDGPLPYGKLDEVN